MCSGNCSGGIGQRLTLRTSQCDAGIGPRLIHGRQHGHSNPRRIGSNQPCPAVAGHDKQLCGSAMGYKASRAGQAVALDRKRCIVNVTGDNVAR